MSTVTRYGLGGFDPNAAAQNKSEQWTNATQAGDPTPAGYTAWDASGNVTSTRALTQAESDALAVQDTANTQATNKATIQQQAQTALTNNQTYLAIASPTTAQAVSQVAALTRQLDGVIRLLLQKFDATN
jgi:hypothetical protein